MSRDYKNTAPARRKKTTRKKASKKVVKKASIFSRLPTWIWFIAGILATIGFMWMKTNWFTPEAPSEPREMTPLSSKLEAEQEIDNKVVQDELESAKAFDLKKDPRFTFYERLPKDEIIIPQEALDIEVDKNKSKEPLQNIERTGSYVLQAGSFQDFADADRRKAELALLGLESSIQKVSIDKRNWFRVRIGPYTELELLNDTRQRLRDGEIDVLVIRTK